MYEAKSYTRPIIKMRTRTCISPTRYSLHQFKDLDFTEKYVTISTVNCVNDCVNDDLAFDNLRYIILAE